MPTDIRRALKYAAVLTALLPIAVHYAMHAPRERQLQDWIAVAVISYVSPALLKLPASISRIIQGQRENCI